MKGLLHRLAARAAGTALPVRSDVRLPFGAGNWGEAVEAQADAAARPTAASLRAQAPIAATDPAAAAPAPMAGVRTAASSRLEARAEPAVFEEHGTSQPRAATQAAATRREERLTARLVREDRDARAPIESPVRQADVQARLEPGETAALPPSPAPQAAPVVAAAPSSQAGRAEPARLMPAATTRPTPAATGPVAGQPAWAVPFPARVAQADEPAEVHVHIGRIDVTALHEPAAPRRRPAAAPAPMSLDTYLARRGRS